MRIAHAHSGLNPLVDQFEASLEELFSSVEKLSDPGPDRLRRLLEARQYDAIIVSVLNDCGYGTNYIRLAGAVARNMMGG